jgi:hypothetical protein
VLTSSEGEGEAPGRRRAVRTSAWDPAFFLKSPLFWPLRPHAAAFEGWSDFPPVEAIDAALAALAGTHFRLQPPRKGRRRRRAGPVDPAALYDARIHLEGWVPTRPSNWHDLLNALVWAAFPRAKKALHGRQHQAIAARLRDGAAALPGRRTRELDGLALLDEGGIALLASASRAEALALALDARDVDAVKRLIQSGEAAAVLFGHALYESLLEAPGPTIWAMAALLPCPLALPSDGAARVALADERLASALAAPASFTHPELFRSVPVDASVLCLAPDAAR